MSQSVLNIQKEKLLFPPPLPTKSCSDSHLHRLSPANSFTKSAESDNGFVGQQAG